MFKKVGLGLLVLATFGLVIAFSWHWTNNQSVVLSCGGWGCKDGGSKSYFDGSGNLKHPAAIIQAERARKGSGWSSGGNFNVLQNLYSKVTAEVNSRLARERGKVDNWKQQADLYKKERDDEKTRAKDWENNHRVLSTELSQERKKATDFKKLADDRNADNVDLRTEIKTKNNRIRDLTDLAQRRFTNVNRLNEEKGQFQTQLKTATNRADGLQTLLDTSNAETESLNIEKETLQTQLSDLQSELTKLHRSQTSISTTIDLEKAPTAKNRSKLALPIGLGVGLGIPALAGAGSGGYFLYKKFGDSLPDLLEKLKFWKK